MDEEGGRPRRYRVFVSYSHRDARWLQRLLVHLKPLERLGLIETWSDRTIRSGSIWRDEIADALATARVAVLLVSADFLASDFIMDVEVPKLLAAAESQGCRIIPIIVSPCRYAEERSISRFQAVNPPSRPLARLPQHEREAVLVEVSKEIERALSATT